jgi:hypothetical protein
VQVEQAAVLWHVVERTDQVVLVALAQP